ncbi:MAG: PAS domain-containing protein, partial [Sphingomonadales bacterium]
MHALAYPRTLIAIGIGVAAAAAAWLLSGDAQVALLVLVAAVAAVLVAAREPEPVVQPPTSAPSRHPLPDTIIEAIGEPVLLIGATRVLAANQAALTLLGEYIRGEDVRVAIRHPAAAERLLAPDGSDAEPIHLVGLGTREQRWEM